MQGGHGGKGVLGRGDRGLRSSNLKGKAADAEGAQVQVVPKGTSSSLGGKTEALRPCQATGVREA